MKGEEHVVLYRKYRPRTFDEVVGQEHVVTVLKNALRLDRVAHAYLFAGTRGTGKTTLARLLAKAFNCQNRGKDGEPCNTCNICREFMLGRSLDLIEIDAASNRGIDDIRELRDAVRFSPMQARRKVYIVDEVHMLTKEAFNALLKTLEEPPAHAMFILATTELDRVPDTILSRVQTFEFRRLSQEKIQNQLKEILKKEKYKLSDETIRQIAFLADGSIRDSETMLGQVMDAYPEGGEKDALEKLFGLPRLQAVHDLIDASLAKDAKRIIETIEKIKEGGIDPKMLSRMLVYEMRMLLFTLLDPARVADEDFAKKYSREDISRIKTLLVKLLEAHHKEYRGPFQELPVVLALLDSLVQ